MIAGAAEHLRRIGRRGCARQPRQIGMLAPRQPRNRGIGGGAVQRGRNPGRGKHREHLADIAIDEPFEIGAVFLL